MTAPAPVLSELLDDAVLGTDRPPDPAVAVREHHRHRQAYGPLVGRLVVSDGALAAVGRAADRTAPLAVSVLSSTGAGGLVSLARRQVAGVDVEAVETALQDLDDLAGNAARVVSAAGSLPETVEVYVELPPQPGWQRAVDVVEAAGLFAAVRVPSELSGRSAVELTGRLSVLVEADLPFRATGAGLDVAGLLAVVDALIEGASVTDAAELLSRPPAPADLLRWSDTDVARIRRRLRRVSCPDLSATLTRLSVPPISRA